MVDYAKVGIVGLLTLLVGMGGVLILTPKEQAASYSCSATGQFGIFYGGISSTGKTAYPYAENKSGSKLCSTGWVKMNFNEQPPEINAKKYLCDIQRCVPVG